jgi:hypothetical protein
MIARAAAAVGISVDLVRRSWAVQSTVKPDRTLVTAGDDLVPVATPRPKPAYAPNYGGNTKAATSGFAASGTDTSHDLRDRSMRLKLATTASILLLCIACNYSSTISVRLVTQPVRDHALVVTEPKA